MLIVTQKGLCHTERALLHDDTERQCNGALKAVMAKRSYE